MTNYDGKSSSPDGADPFVLESELVAKLLLKEDTANKDATALLGASDVKFPTQKAVKTYADAIKVLGLTEPSLKTPPRAQHTVLQQFQAGHAFEKYAGTGVMADDAAVFVRGSQSLKITTLEDESQTKLRKKTIGPYDFTGKNLRVTFKVDGLANAGVFEIFLSSDNLATNNVHYRVASPIQPNIADTEWYTVDISWGDLAANGAVGAIDRTKINFIEFRCEAQLGKVVTFHIQEVSSVPIIPAAGVVSIAFDDGWASTITKAAPYLEKYGYRATAALIRDVLGEENYMTLAQAKALQNDHLWDVCCHADKVANHNLGYSNLSDAVVEEEMANIKKFLIENGFRRRDLFMWPKGLFTASQILIARKFFSAVRGTTGGKGGSGGAQELYPPADPCRLRTFLCGGSTITAAEIETACAEALASKNWLILTYHQVVAAGAAGGLQCNEAVFKEHIDKVNASGIAVKTIAEVLEN